MDSTSSTLTISTTKTSTSQLSITGPSHSPTISVARTCSAEPSSTPTLQQTSSFLPTASSTLSLSLNLTFSSSLELTPTTTSTHSLSHDSVTVLSSGTLSLTPTISASNSLTRLRTTSRTVQLTRTLTTSFSSSMSHSLIVDLINGIGVPRAAKPFLPNVLFVFPERFGRRVVLQAQSWRRNVTLLLARPTQLPDKMPATCELRYQQSVTGSFDYVRLQVDRGPSQGTNWTCRSLAGFPLSQTGCFALVNCEPEATWLPLNRLATVPSEGGIAYDVLRFTLGPLAFENLNCLASPVVSSFVVATTYPLVTVPQYRSALLTLDFYSDASLLLSSSRLLDELVRVANGSAVLTQMRLLQDEQSLSTNAPTARRESLTEGSTTFYHCTINDVTSFAATYVRRNDDLGRNFSTLCKQQFTHVEDAQVFCTGDEQCQGYVTGYGADGSETVFCLLYPGRGADGSADIDPRLVYVKTTAAERTCTFTIDSTAIIRVYIQQTFLSNSFATVISNQKAELASCGQLMPFLGGQLGRSSLCDVYSSCFSGTVDGGSVISVTADATMAQGGCVNSLGVILEVVFPFQASNAPTPSPEIRKGLARVFPTGLGFSVLARDTAYFYVAGASQYLLLLYQTGFECRGSGDSACRAPLVNTSGWNVTSGREDPSHPLQSCGGSLPFLFNNPGLSNQMLTSYFCGFPFSPTTGEEDVNASVTINSAVTQYSAPVAPVAGRIGQATPKGRWLQIETRIAALGRLSRGQSAKLVGTLYVQLEGTGNKANSLAGFLLHASDGLFAPLLLVPSGSLPSSALNASIETQLLPSIGSIFGTEHPLDAYLVNWTQEQGDNALPPSSQLGCVMDWISVAWASCDIPVSPRSNFFRVSVAQTFMIPSTVTVSVEYLSAGGTVVESATCGGSTGFIGISSRNDECTTYLPCTAGFVASSVTLIRITVPQSVTMGGTCTQAFSAFVETDWRTPPPQQLVSYREKFLCVADKNYIFLPQLCDGVTDCIDGADEDQCEDWHLVETNFTYPLTNATTTAVSHPADCVARGIASATTAVALFGDTTCFVFGPTSAAQFVAEPNRFVLAAVGFTVFAYLPKGTSYARCSRFVTCSNNGEVIITGGGTSCACQCESAYGGSDCSQPLDMSFVGPTRITMLTGVVLSPAEINIALIRAAPFPVGVACSAFSPIEVNGSSNVFTDCAISGAADSVAAFHALAATPATLVGKLNERLGGVVVNVGIATAPTPQPIFGCGTTGSGVACPLAKSAPVETLSLTIAASTAVETAVVHLGTLASGAVRRSSGGGGLLELSCTVGRNAFVTTDLSGCQITVCRLPLGGTVVSSLAVNTSAIDQTVAAKDDPCFSPYTASVVYSLKITALETPLQVINTFADYTQLLHGSIATLAIAGAVYLGSLVFKLLHFKHEHMAVKELLRRARCVTSSVELVVPALHLAGFTAEKKGKLKAELWSVGALIIALDMTIAGFFAVILFMTSTGYNSNVEVVMEHYRDGLCSASATAPTPGQSWLFNSRTARECIRRPNSGTSFGSVPLFAVAYCDMDASGNVSVLFKASYSLTQCTSQTIVRVPSGACVASSLFFPQTTGFIQLSCAQTAAAESRFQMLRTLNTRSKYRSTAPVSPVLLQAAPAANGNQRFQYRSFSTATTNDGGLKGQQWKAECSAQRGDITGNKFDGRRLVAQFEDEIYSPPSPPFYNSPKTASFEALASEASLTALAIPAQHASRDSDLPIGNVYGGFNGSAAASAALGQQASRYYGLRSTPADIGNVFSNALSEGDGVSLSFWLRATGESFGVVLAISDAREAFSEDELPLLQKLVSLVGSDSVDSSSWDEVYNIYLAVFLDGPSQALHLIFANPAADSIVIDRVWNLAALGIARLLNGAWHHVAILIRSENHQLKAQLVVDGETSLSKQGWNQCLPRGPVPIAVLPPGTLMPISALLAERVTDGGMMTVGYFSGGVALVRIEVGVADIFTLWLRTSDAIRAHVGGGMIIYALFGAVAEVLGISLLAVWVTRTRAEALEEHESVAKESRATARRVLSDTWATSSPLCDELGVPYILPRYEVVLDWLGLDDEEVVIFIREVMTNIAESPKDAVAMPPAFELVRLLYHLSRCLGSDKRVAKEEPMPSATEWCIRIAVEELALAATSDEVLRDAVYQTEHVHVSCVPGPIPSPSLPERQAAYATRPFVVEDDILVVDVVDDRIDDEVSWETRPRKFKGLAARKKTASEQIPPKSTKDQIKGQKEPTGEKDQASRSRPATYTAAPLSALVLPVVQVTQTMDVWFATMKFPYRYRLTVGHIVTLIGFDSAAFFQFLPLLPPQLWSFVLALIIASVLFYVVVLDEKCFAAHLARYLIRIDGTMSPSSSEELLLMLDISDKGAASVSTIWKDLDELTTLDVLDLPQARRVDRFLHRCSDALVTSLDASSSSLPIGENNGTVPERTVKIRCGRDQYVLALKETNYAADDRGEQLDENDVMVTALRDRRLEVADVDDEKKGTGSLTLERVGTCCPLHPQRRLSSQLQTDVWPFSHRPSCCVSASGVRCGVSTGLMYRCGERSSSEDGQMHICHFGLCEKHFQGSASAAFIATQLELVRFIEERGLTVPFASAVLFIMNAMFTPFVKTALMILSCHPYMQCLLPKCWAAPNQEFILAAYLSAAVVFTVGTAVPVVLSLLLWRRRHLISLIFFSDAMSRSTGADKMEVELSQAASAAEWSRFAQTDYSALSSLYRDLRFRWIFTTPLLLMWKGIYLIAPLVLEPGSFSQLVCVGLTEVLFAIFAFLTSPSPSHIANAVFRIGSVHQLMLLGLVGFDTYMRYETGADFFFVPMLVLTLCYLGICGAFIVYNLLLPVFFSINREKITKFLALVGIQFSETTNLYRICVKKESTSERAS